MNSRELKAWIVQQYNEDDPPKQTERRERRVTIVHHWNIRIYKSTVYINRNTGEEHEPPPDTCKH